MTVTVTLATGSDPVGLVAAHGMSPGTRYFIQNTGGSSIQISAPDRVATDPKTLTGWHNLSPSGPISALIVEPSSGGEIYVWGTGSITFSEAV